jgi:hypothetical protein
MGVASRQKEYVIINFGKPQNRIFAKIKMGSRAIQRFKSSI